MKEIIRDLFLSLFLIWLPLLLSFVQTNEIIALNYWILQNKGRQGLWNAHIKATWRYSHLSTQFFTLVLKPCMLYFLALSASSFLNYCCESRNYTYTQKVLWDDYQCKRPWCWEKIESRRRGWQRMRWLDGITDTMGMNLGKLWEMVRENSGRPGVLRSMGSPRAGHDLVTQQQLEGRLCRHFWP